MRKILTLLGLTLLSFVGLGQTISNNCSVAVAQRVTVNATCVPSASLTMNTALGAPALTTCTATGNDGWLWFQALSTSTIINFTTTAGDAVIFVYSGACGSLTQLACVDALVTGTETITLATTIGTQYKIRIVSYGASNAVGTICVYNAPPPPANDACANATALPCGTTNLAGTTVNTIAETAPNSCASSYGVWYTFTGNGCSTTISSTATFDHEMDFFSGTCGTLANISCIDNSTGVETYTMSTVNGTTYYIYLAHYSTSSTTTGTFTITRTCVLPCAGTPNAGNLSASVSPVTCASPTSIVTAANLSTDCGVTYQWQSAPAAAGPWTNIVGATGTSITVSPVVDTWYHIISTCSYSGLSNTSGSQRVNSSITPPLNDNCAGAVSLTVNADLACGVVTAGTTVCATNSGISACVGSGADDDVWFRFIATNSNVNITITNVSGSSDCVHEIFTGTCPGSLTSVACSDPESSQWTGLTVGSTYYIRVYTYSTLVSSVFNICLGTPPPPPTNDEPCGAISLNVNAGSCSYQTAILGTMATLSAGIPAPGCSSLGPDVWFTATVPASGRLIVDLSASGGPTDMGMAWYTGPSCNNLTTLVECDDDDSQNGAMPMICKTGVACTVPGDCQQNATLAPGTLVYVRVWEYGGGTFGPFDICAYEPQAPGAPSTCASATVIATLPFSDAGQTTCCRANDYTAANGCVSSYQDGEDYLYKYTPAANIVIDITTTGTLAYTGIFITDRCPNSGGVVCIASSTSATGNPSLCGVSLTGGTTYYIMIDTDPTPVCTPFNINITSSSSPTCGLNYTTSSIAFAPDLNNGTDIALPIDDRFSSSYISIGFPFCFDGYQFTQLLVSSNGYVIFDPIACASNLPTTNAAPNTWSDYSVEAAIPNTTNAPRNSIMFPWQDIGPHLGGTIKYQVLGVTPNRRFVLTYNNIPYYDCETQLFTGQLKLYETTNNIEIHLDNKEVCTTWSYSFPGKGILGLHNYNGTIAKFPAGHNFAGQWTSNNEAWRFTCNCVGCIIPLPIELINFDVKCIDGQRIISWETTSEKNSDRFIIQNSEDGINFNDIESVDASGNSNTPKKYSFVDNNYYGDKTVYYKLFEYDFDGSKQEFDIFASNCKENTEYAIYPNPVNHNDNIYVLGNIQNIKVYDIVGNEINVNIVDNVIKGLSVGVYIIKINDSYINKLIVK